METNRNLSRTAKLTEKEVRAIRLAYARGGYTQSKLCKIFDVSIGTIASIVRRETWQWVKDEEPNHEE